MISVLEAMSEAMRMRASWGALPAPSNIRRAHCWTAESSFGGREPRARSVPHWAKGCPLSEKTQRSHGERLYPPDGGVAVDDTVLRSLGRARAKPE
jgi:hypothetical protein